MRHRKFGSKLGRNTNQRQALIKNQIRSLFQYGYIKTTLAKTKVILKSANKYCRVALQNSLSSRRQLYTLLQNQHWVNSFQKSLIDNFSTASASFFQITKLYNRQGDDATMVKISFIKPLTSSKQAPTKITPPAKPTPAKIVKPKTKNDHPKK